MAPVRVTPRPCAARVGRMVWPTLLAVAATVYLVVRIALTLRATDARSVRPIEVASVPPPELTPGLAARLLRGTHDQDGMSAEVVDLALKGVWQLGVRDVDDTATWFVQRRQPYEPILSAVPQAVYRAIFSRGDTTLSRNLVPDEHRTAGLAAAKGIGRRVAEEKGWIRLHRDRHLILNLIGQGLISAAIIIPATAALATTGGPVNPAGPEGLPFLVYGGSVGFIGQFLGTKPWTLTPEGRRLVDELEGLRRHMTLPDHERRAADVAAHERLLPYAVLFGIVPEWVEVLRAGHERAGTTPTWVQGEGRDPVAAASVFASLARVGAVRRLGT